ncbi:MAG: helix-turn-helix transcriptional regulator [Alphaproteobacteria bacterium]|nr:helix-turn-helix transcriptional regulator [Alphaproteobacteria bacterium]
MAKNTDEHAPHPLDIALGSRVRLRRKELGFSQDQLARSVGITFQQVQKYEHGTNRISFSRLVEIADALECSVADLIGNLDKSKSSASLSRQIAYLTEPGASDLLEAYASIDSPKRRRAILNLARQLANDQQETSPPARASATSRRSSARA